MIYPDVCICRHVMTDIYIYRYRTYFHIHRMHHAFLLRHPAPHRAALAADAKPSVVIGCGEPRCARNDDAAEAVQNVPRTEGLSLVWSWHCCGFGEDFRWFQWPFRKNLSKTWFWFIVISDQMAISRYVTSKRRQSVMSFHMTATGVPLGRWCRRNRELAIFL